MDQHWNILVVSAHLENRRAILRILDGLSVNAFAASTIQQALEVLGKQSIRLVFCEETFVDGTFRHLVASVNSTERKTPIVLMLSTGEWDKYLKAISMGASEALRCPFEPTDVELALIRAAREQGAKIECSLEKTPARSRTSSSAAIDSTAY